MLIRLTIVKNVETWHTRNLKYAKRCSISGAFGEVGSEIITKIFLQEILNQKITKIDLSKNSILRRMKPTSKMGVLDVYAEINGNEKCNKSYK